MDESTVRRAAEDHGRALVEGNLQRAGSAWYAWNEDVKQMAGSIMPMMPNPVSSSDVESITQEGDQFVVLTRYAGGDKECVVESRWEEREGQSKMVAAKVSETSGS
jgi:hypothetical protein